MKTVPLIELGTTPGALEGSVGLGVSGPNAVIYNPTKGGGYGLAVHTGAPFGDCARIAGLRRAIERVGWPIIHYGGDEGEPWRHDLVTGADKETDIWVTREFRRRQALWERHRVPPSDVEPVFVAVTDTPEGRRPDRCGLFPLWVNSNRTAHLSWWPPMKMYPVIIAGSGSRLDSGGSSGKCVEVRWYVDRYLGSGVRDTEFSGPFEFDPAVLL